MGNAEPPAVQSWTAVWRERRSRRLRRRRRRRRVTGSRLPSTNRAGSSRAISSANISETDKRWRRREGKKNKNARTEGTGDGGGITPDDKQRGARTMLRPGDSEPYLGILQFERLVHLSKAAVSPEHRPRFVRDRDLWREGLSSLV